MRRPGVTSKISIYGHTDNVGSAEENLELSQRRAKWLADYLVKAGVYRDRLIVSGLGASSPLVITPPNTPEPQNRSAFVHWSWACPR